jgi:fluoride ion exporter CrcB/FEX
MENVQLLRNGEVFPAIANILISITTCITLLWFLSRQNT